MIRAAAGRPPTRNWVSICPAMFQLMLGDANGGQPPSLRMPASVGQASSGS